MVVFAACACSLFGAGFHARRLSVNATARHELERLLGAVKRACAEFLWRETRLLCLALIAVGVALAVPLVVWNDDARAPLAWAGVALCLGAAAGCGAAHLGQWASTRAAAHALDGLRRDLEGTATEAARGAGVVALACDALSLLVTTFVFVGHYLYLSSGSEPGRSQSLIEASQSLPAAALGALCAAAIFQIGGSSFHTAAGVAGAAARARYSSIARDEEQNPALVAELVGGYAGGVVSRAADTFAAMMLANAGSVWVAAVVANANQHSGPAAIAIVSLPLVIRSVGLVAGTLAVANLRFNAPLPLPTIFSAGAASQVLISATGAFGATLWLLGEPAYLTYFGAAGLGLLAAALSTGLSLWSEHRRSLPAASHAFAASRGETSVARALGLGLQHTWSPLLVVGVCLGAACFLGSRMPIEHGASYALVIAVAAMLGSGSFSLCQSLFTSIAETVRRISVLRRGGFDEAGRGRAEELADSAIGVGNLGHTQCILGSASAAMLVALALPLLSSSGRAAAGGAGAVHPIVIIGGLLGAGSSLFHVGGMLKLSSRAAHALDQNLRDRLDTAASAGAPVGSALPSYRVSLALAASTATDSVLPLALGALLTPFCVGVLLRAVYGPAGNAMAAQALMAFGTMACLTGCSAALAAQGTLHALHGRQGLAKLGGNGSGNSASEFIGRCVGPAALFGFKAMVISSLAAAPLLS